MFKQGHTYSKTSFLLSLSVSSSLYPVPAHEVSCGHTTAHRAGEPEEAFSLWDALVSAPIAASPTLW